MKNFSSFSMPRRSIIKEDLLGLKSPTERLWGIKLNFKMNKKGDVAILALVLLSVILLGSTLFVFYNNSAKISNEINDARFLNAIYLKEQQIDFYINEIIDRSLKKSFDENSFILEFKKNLKFYDKNDILVREELLRIAEEINENNVEYGKELVLNVKTQIVIKEKNIIATYNYDKKFVRKI